MKIRKLRLYVMTVLGLTSLGVSVANAFTGREMMEVFNKNDRITYVTGAVDMASYNSVLLLDVEHAKCINSWFHTSDLRAMRTIEKAFKRYPDKHVEPILLALIKKKCGVAKPKDAE